MSFVWTKLKIAERQIEVQYYVHCGLGIELLHRVDRCWQSKNSASFSRLDGQILRLALIDWVFSGRPKSLQRVVSQDFLCTKVALACWVLAMNML
jgi:hypothetical protein